MHLAIDVVLKSLKGKARGMAELCVQVFIFLFAFSVMVTGGIRLVSITLKLNQISAALRIQLGYVYCVLPLSGLLIMFYAVIFFLEGIRSFKEKPAVIPPGSLEETQVQE